MTVTAIVPSQRGNLLLGNLLPLQRDPLQFLSNLSQIYGGVVRYPVGAWRDLYFLSHPDAVRHVLVTNSRRYSVRNRSRNLARLLGGEGVFFSEGESWLRQRRLMQPTFQRHHMVEFVSLIVTTTTETLAKWIQTDQPLDMAQAISRLTLDIATKSLFGVDLGDTSRRIGPLVQDVLRSFATYMRSPLVFLPTSVVRLHRGFQTAMRDLDKVVYQIIAERQQRGGGNDLLSMLLAARDEETEEGMTAQQLRDEVMTLLVAGHETTAAALTWTLHLLSTHQEIAERVKVELTKTLAGRLPTITDLPNLPYTRQVFEEAMRLYPPVWSLFRRAVEVDEIEGYPIPARSIVTLSPYITHRHPDFWENPTVFDPERFNPDKVADRHPFAYFPFGGGPRQCLGKHFAMMEAHLILAVVLQRVSLRLLVPASTLQVEALATLRPKEGLPMQLTLTSA